MWYIIVNPNSGSGKGLKKWKKLETALKQLQIPYEVAFTTAKGDAIHLAKSILEKGGRALIGVGGDGTNHEIVNGVMLQQVCPSAEVSYTLFGAGRGNDWARTYKLPTDAYLFAKMLISANSRLQDLGKVRYQSPQGTMEERFFVNVAGMAFDGYVTRAADKAEGGGHLQYLWQLIKCLTRYQLTTATLQYENKQVTDDFYTINVGICKYSGGGMQFVPHAIPNDGLLALTYVGKLPKWVVIMQTYRFYLGTIAEYSKVNTAQVKQCSVQHAEGARPTYIEADGEYLGTSPVEYIIIPQALKVIC